MKLKLSLVLMGGLVSMALAAEDAHLSVCHQEDAKQEAFEVVSGIAQSVQPIAELGFPQAQHFFESLNDRLVAASLAPSSAFELCDGVFGVEALTTIPAYLDRLYDVLGTRGEVLAAVASGAPRRGGGCLGLDDSAREVAETVAFALDQVAITAQGICDGTSCLPVVCTATCAAAGIAEDAATITRTVLLVDTFCSQSSHDAAAQAAFEEPDATPAVLEDVFDDQLGPSLPKLDKPITSLASKAELDSASANWMASTDQLSDDADELRQRLVSQQQALSANRSAQIRTLIEDHLRSDLAAPLVRLQIPLANGGSLETVRRIVADSINTIIAAGLDPTAAFLEFDAGDVELNQSRPRAAFQLYRAAYQAAASAPPASPRCSTCSRRAF